MVGTAPAEKQCSLISILLEERGWKEWPSEDWFVSEAGEMLRRPKDAQSVGFCNCASYSTVVVDVPGSDWAYDRLLRRLGRTGFGDLPVGEFRARDKGERESEGALGLRLNE